MDLDKLSLTELTAIEAKAEEYRQRVRALIQDKSKCTICMERESVIIFYPCKHAITCACGAAGRGPRTAVTRPHRCGKDLGGGHVQRHQWGGGAKGLGNPAKGGSGWLAPT